MNILSRNEEDTYAIATALATQCTIGDCIGLRGDLGAGKTVFARGFIRALCDMPGDIVSPTFTLVQSYPIRNGGAIWHFDGYRLEKPQDVWELGFEEALTTGITLMEWPQRIAGFFPADALTAEIGNTHGQERMITLSSMHPAWQPRLSRLKETYHDPIA